MSPSGSPAAPAASVIESPGASSAPETSIVRQRISSTIDPLGQRGSEIGDHLLPLRTEAVKKIYLGIQQVQENLALVKKALSVATLPPKIIGTLQQPDGTVASFMQMEFDPATLGNSSPPVITHTDSQGVFQFSPPAGIARSDAGIPLKVHGLNTNADVVIPSVQIASNGFVGSVKLPTALHSLPISILTALQASLPGSSPSTKPDQPAKQPQLPTVKLGEANDDLLSIAATNSVDTFPYGIFFRLVEPRLSIVNQAHRIPVSADSGARHFILPIYSTAYSEVVARLAATSSADGTGSSTGDGNFAYVDRIPVEQPLSVDGFRDQVMGLTANGLFTADETVPMAATLGLGYVLWMSQRWTFQGVGLGDLVYSLPLAPGEQQQIAISERQDTTLVYESESLSEQQAEAQRALSDTSTSATFNSAFREAVNGGSTFTATSDSSSVGGSLIFISGGSGSSSSSGSTAEWLQGQRNSTQQAAETAHSATENQASARRSAQRTSMRMASASESESVTTKVITNHNHTRALTMQYWEVLRLYDVTAAIDGLTLACLVPLQVVRFMPPNQTLTLSDTSIRSRADVLSRYSAIIKHADVLAQVLPRTFQRGLTLLQQFAADPTATTVSPAGSPAEDVIAFSLYGTFVPCEDVSITAVTKRNTRVGPVKLGNMATAIQPGLFVSQDDLLASLRNQRQNTIAEFTGNLALPPTMNRNDIIGFEISRSHRQIDYTLVSPEIASLKAVKDLFTLSDTGVQQALGTVFTQGTVIPQTTVHIPPADLERVLGGPILTGFQAKIVNFNADGSLNVDGSSKQPPAPSETYANDSLNGIELPPQPYPVPALQLGPLLRFNELLEIEQMAQHVVRNTITYSKAIWASMTPDERAILLDGYTIGVSPDGITDESQMIPLLNCVENRLLGFFGNSMILPFIVPQAIAGQPDPADTDPAHLKVDPAQLQNALLTYQRADFDPPHSTIALPTRGVLGEAVLGHSPSAEKIDLTRFWNWSDAPADTATAISPITLPTTTPSLAAGLTAPDSLTKLPSLINNVLSAPTPDTSLLQSLAKTASQPDFSNALTGAAQLAPLITNAQNTANAARADALKTTKDLQSQAMATVGNIVGGIYGGNPNAGSNAAAAVNGKGGGSTSSTQKSGGQSNATSTKSAQNGSTPPTKGPQSGSPGSQGDAPATGDGSSVPDGGDPGTNISEV